MFDLMPFDRRTRNITDYFNRLEKEFFGDLSPSVEHLKTDILDKGDKYVLQAEMPGFDRENIAIDIDGDRLTIKAEHKAEEETQNDNYIRKERRYGSYQRSFDISGIDADGIAASYENGILELELPKKEPPKNQPRQVEIK